VVLDLVLIFGRRSPAARGRGFSPAAGVSVFGSNSSDAEFMQ
jgi:hypothetical protein